jgi:hypothetical protein
MTVSDLLYYIGMESPTGYANMQWLCDLAGVQFPPKTPTPNTAARDALPDPLN